MAISEGKILLAATSLEDVSKSLINDLVDEESEIITIIYGQDVSENDANELAAFVEEKFSHADVEVYSGKQPLYPYIISVE